MEYKEQINEIMLYFDWEKVHRAMTSLNWKWGLGDDASVPSVRMLQESAERLLKDAWQSSEKTSWEDAYWASGGFEAFCRGRLLTLKFVVSNWAIYPEG